MTLAAYEGPHFVSARILVRVIGDLAIAVTPPLNRGQMRYGRRAFRQRLDAANKSGTGYPEVHGVGCVAVHAGDRMRMPHVVQHFVGLLIAHGEGLFKALVRVAVAELAVERHHRGVAVDARAGLGLRLSLGLFLILQHVRVAPSVSIVDGKRIAREHALEPGIPFDLFFGEGLGAAVSAETGASGDGGATVGIVLFGPVLAPDRRIGGVFIHLHQTHVWTQRLGLAFENIHQKGSHQHRRPCSRDGHGDNNESEFSLIFILRVHLWLLPGCHFGSAPPASSVRPIPRVLRGPRLRDTSHTSPHPCPWLCQPAFPRQYRHGIADSFPEGYSYWTS